jgi:hypothetical protein
MSIFLRIIMVSQMKDFRKHGSAAVTPWQTVPARFSPLQKRKILCNYKFWALKTPHKGKR